MTLLPPLLLFGAAHAERYLNWQLRATYEYGYMYAKMGMLVFVYLLVGLLYVGKLRLQMQKRVSPLPVFFVDLAALALFAAIFVKLTPFLPTLFYVHLLIGSVAVQDTALFLAFCFQLCSLGYSIVCLARGGRGAPPNAASSI